MSSAQAPTVTITPTNTTASAAGATVSAGQTPSPAQETTPLYTVYAKYDYDPRSFAVGTYLSYVDARAGLEAQVINGAELSIYEMHLIDRTAG